MDLLLLDITHSKQTLALPAAWLHHLCV